MKVYVDCVGCEQRKIDSQRIINYLKANEIETVQSPKSCDYAILVTCGVDKAKEEESISRLEEISKTLPTNSRLIVGGCLPSIDEQKIASHKVYATFSPRTLESLDSLFSENIHKKMKDTQTPNRSFFDNVICLNGKNLSARQEYDLAKEGYKIVIDEGCLLSCSYCVIKNATGRLKSQPMETIISQFEKGIAQKEPRIMLMGGDTGAYGRDIGLRFYDLLEELIKYSGQHKLFIHDFNINWFIADLKQYCNLFEKNERENRIQTVTFPVQSGSDRILKLMKRPYTSGDCANALKKVKQGFPSLAIGTHIIIGFPTESNEDFQSTLNLMNEANFDFVSCFLYSENRLAESTKISGKIDEEVMKERAMRIKKMLGNKVRIFGV